MMRPKRIWSTARLADLRARCAAAISARALYTLSRRRFGAGRAALLDRRRLRCRGRSTRFLPKPDCAPPIRSTRSFGSRSTSAAGSRRAACAHAPRTCRSGSPAPRCVSMCIGCCGRAARRIAHAASLGRDGRGILLLGHGGAGKSGTALAGVAAGLQTVGDDYVALSGLRSGRRAAAVPHRQAGPRRPRPHRRAGGAAGASAARTG